jgi:hypothetical protein
MIHDAAKASEDDERLAALNFQSYTVDVEPAVEFVITQMRRSFETIKRD